MSFARYLSRPAAAVSVPANPTVASPATSRSASAYVESAIEAALLLGLGTLALAVRLPNYQLVPVFTDETVEHYYSVLILQGQPLPLTAGAAYMGSLWTWLVAAAYWVSGYSLHAPRTLILLIGVLTVVATYPLGRAWGGRLGGMLAAVLMSTAAGHVVVNSHVAWGNCATPLFTTLAVWTSYAAVHGTTFRPRTALLLTGLFWGLAFQTHPSVLARYCRVR
jgi:hypothetical protein